MKTDYAICKDNLQFMQSLPNDSIDLIYIDPPFFCQKDFKNKNGIGFSDSWPSRDAYLNFIRSRTDQCHALLKDTGSLFFHCDWRINHHIRLMLDKVFGESNFVNEIIWCYTGPSGTKKYFPKKHDNIFWYSKTKIFVFNSDAIRVPYVIPKARGSNGIFKNNFILNKKGKIIEDWWADISTIAKFKSEIVGYPTQKAEKLLERIIKACSNEGDVVADFFCGSGTTLVAAQNLNRKYIGCDINQDAVNITNERLSK